PGPLPQRGPLLGGQLRRVLSRASHDAPPRCRRVRAGGNGIEAHVRAVERGGASPILLGSQAASAVTACWSGRSAAASSAAYAPSVAIRWSWLPRSTIRPPPRTTIWSASRIVDRRRALVLLEPPCRCS